MEITCCVDDLRLGAADVTISPSTPGTVPPFVRVYIGETGSSQNVSALDLSTDEAFKIAGLLSAAAGEAASASLSYGRVTGLSPISELGCQQSIGKML